MRNLFRSEYARRCAHPSTKITTPPQVVPCTGSQVLAEQVDSTAVRHVVEVAQMKGAPRGHSEESQQALDAERQLTAPTRSAGKYSDARHRSSHGTHSRGSPIPRVRPGSVAEADQPEPLRHTEVTRPGVANDAAFATPPPPVYLS
jgi:hypothetical protein